MKLRSPTARVVVGVLAALVFVTILRAQPGSTPQAGSTPSASKAETPRQTANLLELRDSH